MTESLRQRALEGLFRLRGSSATGTVDRSRQHERERHDKQHEHRKHRQRRLPAEIVDQRDAERCEHELSERTRRGARAQRDAAPFLRQQLAEGRQHQIERTAGQTETDQKSGADIERQRRAGITHHQQAGGIHQRTDANHTHAAEPVGNRAGEGLADPPQQILNGKGECEDIAAPRKLAAHGLHEEAEGRTRPERQHADQAAADDDHQRRAPADPIPNPAHIVVSHHGVPICGVPDHTG